MLQGPSHIPDLCECLDPDVLAYPSSLLPQSRPCIQSHALEILILVAQHLNSDPRMALLFAPRVCQNLHGYLAEMRNPLNQWQDRQHYDHFAILICCILTSLPLEPLQSCACFTWTCTASSTVAELQEACTHNDDNLRCINVYWHMVLELLVADGHTHDLPASPQSSSSTSTPSSKLKEWHRAQICTAAITDKALYASMCCIVRLACCSAFRAAATQQAAYLVRILRRHLSHRNPEVSLAAVEALHAILCTECCVSGVTDGLVFEISPLLDVRSNPDLLVMHAMDLLLTQEPSPTFFEDVFHSGALACVVHSVLSTHRAPMKYLAQATMMFRAFTSFDTWRVLPAVRLDLMAALLTARAKARAVHDEASAVGQEPDIGLQVVEVGAREGVRMLQWLCHSMDSDRRAALLADMRRGLRGGDLEDLNWGPLPGESSSGGVERARERWGCAACPSLFQRMVHRCEGVYPAAEAEVAMVVYEEQERLQQGGRGGGRGAAAQAVRREDKPSGADCAGEGCAIPTRGGCGREVRGGDDAGEQSQDSLRERYQAVGDGGDDGRSMKHGAERGSSGDGVVCIGRSRPCCAAGVGCCMGRIG